METLRIRVRTGELPARRGPHGRYYVSLSDLEQLTRPRRARRRHFEAGVLEDCWPFLEALLEVHGLSAASRELVTSVRAQPKLDLHLYRLLAVYALYLRNLTPTETADLLGISSRQVRNLRRKDLVRALRQAAERKRRAERGSFRRQARLLVKDLQARLQAAGFRAARRDRRRIESGARAGLTARLALVTKLDHATVLRLLEQGLSEDQVRAIQLLGIGADELNELILHGLPPAPLS